MAAPGYTNDLAKNWLNPNTHTVMAIELLSGKTITGTIQMRGDDCVEVAVRETPGYVVLIFDRAIATIREAPAPQSRPRRAPVAGPPRETPPGSPRS